MVNVASEIERLESELGRLRTELQALRLLVTGSATRMTQPMISADIPRTAPPPPSEPPIERKAPPISETKELGDPEVSRAPISDTQPQSRRNIQEGRYEFVASPRRRRAE
jgi:hypothetical protein